MRALSLRARLALVLVVGLLAAAAVAAPAVRDRAERWRDARDREAQLALVPALERAGRAVQTEATTSVRYLTDGEPTARRRLATERVESDRAVRALLDLSAAHPSGAQPAVSRFGLAWAAWRRSRVTIDRRTAPDVATLMHLRNLGARATAPYAPLAATTTGATARDLTAIGALAAAREALGAQQRDLVVILTRATLPPEVVPDLRAATDTVTTQIAAARATLPRTTATINADANLRAAEAAIRPFTDAVTAGLVPFRTVDDWIGRSDRELAVVDGLALTAAGHLRAVAAAATADARHALVRIGLLVAGVLLVALGAGLLVVRSIRRSVRLLTTAAETSAARRADSNLGIATAHQFDAPAPLLRARGELGDLARSVRSLDEAAGSALARSARPAGDESELVVKLARRNQPLLTRQLELLDRLEAGETDADHLRSLFQLDQLATRMRRNGESLLVLAGLEGERSPMEPMPLLDVVRGAVSEIAHFARIDIVGVPTDLGIRGDAGADLVHALAELLENAATFSKPDTRVFVGAHKHAAGLELTISDEGIGIPVPRLDELNELLGHPPMPGLDLSRALGLVVVARLCERIGARVTLRSAPDVGTSAVVVIPAAVMVPLAARVVEVPESSIAPEPVPLGEPPTTIEPEPSTVEAPSVETPAEPEPSTVEAPSVETPAEPEPSTVEAPAVEPEPTPVVATRSGDAPPEPRRAPLHGSAPPRRTPTVVAPVAAGGEPARPAVHFSPVPVVDTGDLLPSGQRRTYRRRPARRVPTGTLHLAPAAGSTTERERSDPPTGPTGSTVPDAESAAKGIE
ncbi:MAG: ATP-binding protein [Acidimicrobiia bacterium]